MTSSVPHCNSMLTSPEFWHTKRPRPQPLPNGTGSRAVEWAFEDECRTVALIEKIKYVMENVQDSSQPIAIKNGPSTAVDAVKNLYAFSDEGRRSSPKTTIPHNSIQPVRFPPLPACYGWTIVRQDELPLLHPPVYEEVDERFDWHWAIIYEVVPKTAQNTEIGQSHLDFFYAMGFALEAYKPDNWHGGRLIDFNDICSPLSQGWCKTAVRARDAKVWFWTLDVVQAPVRKIIRRTSKSSARRLQLS